ncbi:MAG: alpha/beta hydrolase [Erythrobacter sp.]
MLAPFSDDREKGDEANMEQGMHPAFSDHPRPEFSSAKPGAIAGELGPLNKAIGWLVINRFTYRIMRALGGRNRPEFDRSCVAITERPELGAGTLVVTPTKRQSAGALMLIHGGGFVMSRPQDILPKAAHFSRTLGVAVICPGYRLAPEAKFPVAHNDCHNVWTNIVKNAGELSIDPNAIVVGGYSAGSGLAANLIHRLRDEGGTQPAGQLLIYPMLDDRTALRTEIDKPRHRVWSNRNNRFGWTSFLGHALGQDCAPYAVAARREDLSGLPPTWLGVGNCDLFLDENREYFQKLSDAGNDCTYVEVDGAIHGFDMSGTELGKAFTASQVDFLRRLLV